MTEWDLVREALTELSSRDEQLRLWFPNEDTEMSSLTEAWIQLFDDSRLQDALNEDNERLVESGLDVVLKDLRKALFKASKIRYLDLIDSREMDRVRELSKSALEHVKLLRF